MQFELEGIRGIQGSVLVAGKVDGCDQVVSFPSVPVYVPATSYGTECQNILSTTTRKSTHLKFSIARAELLVNV